MAKFGKDNPGRPKGVQNWWTEIRNQLRQHTPKAMAALLDAVQAGDVAALRLYFSIVTPPTKATYPPVAIALDSPRVALTEIKAALRAGTISADHAAALLDVLERTNRLETAVALADATLVETSPLETAQAMIDTARQSADLTTVMDATKAALPYLVPKPQPEPPPASGIVSNEPVGLDGDDWEKKYAGQTEENTE